jgi:predicted DNA binding CopG/RHH family protein
MANPCVQCRVTSATKSRLQALAREHGVTESALLKRLIEIALIQSVGLSEDQRVQPAEPVSRDARVYVRLRADDLRLLRERASGRGMVPATYVANLLRAHFNSLPPLPEREFGELKRAVAELGVIGRSLNQVVLAITQAGRAAGPSAQELHALLRACVALKDHVKNLLIANSVSWGAGNAEKNR